MGQSWIDVSVDDSQAKWDKGAWQWHLLKAMNEAFCSLCHWEYLYDEEHDIVYTNMQGHGHKFGAAYNAVIYQCLISLTKNSAEYLLLLYASCCCFCQAVTESYAKQVTLTTQISLMASMKARQ